MLMISKPLALFLGQCWHTGGGHKIFIEQMHSSLGEEDLPKVTQGIHFRIKTDSLSTPSSRPFCLMEIFFFLSFLPLPPIGLQTRREPIPLSQHPPTYPQSPFWTSSARINSHQEVPFCAQLGAVKPLTFEFPAAPTQPLPQGPVPF